MKRNASKLLALALAILAGAVPGCAVPRSAEALRQPEAPRGPSLRVLTFNVNWGMPGADESLAAIRASDADLVCLQETTPDWESLLRQQLGRRYPHLAFRHFPGAGGLAVLSRHPFRERALLPPGKAGWFPGWIVEVESPVGPVQVLSLHLRPPLSEGGSATASAYLETRRLRLEEAQDLYRRLHPGRPALVLGDFNETESGEAMEWLRGQGLADPLRELDPSTPTWRWRWGLVSIARRYDRILHSAELRCLEARVLPVRSSDHSPVLAVFERRTG